MRQMCQQGMTLAIVSIVLLLDSVLNVTTVPIIPEYLQGFYLHKITEDLLGTITNSTDEQNPLGEDGSELQRFHPIEGDSKVPAAIAFKALIQIIVSPFGRLRGWSNRLQHTFGIWIECCVLFKPDFCVCPFLWKHTCGQGTTWRWISTNNYSRFLFVS